MGTEIENRATALQQLALGMGHGWTGEAYTVNDVDSLLENALDLLMLVDKELGIEPIEARWK